MDSITPAVLALESGVDQRRVREVLRDLYGTLPDDTTRWVLDDAQVEEVRSRLGGLRLAKREWSLEIGDTVRSSAP